MKCTVFLNLRRVQNPATSDVPRMAGADLRAAHLLLQGGSVCHVAICWRKNCIRRVASPPHGGMHRYPPLKTEN